MTAAFCTWPASDVAYALIALVGTALAAGVVIGLGMQQSAQRPSITSNKETNQ